MPTNRHLPPSAPICVHLWIEPPIPAVANRAAISPVQPVPYVLYDRRTTIRSIDGHGHSPAVRRTFPGASEGASGAADITGQG